MKSFYEIVLKEARERQRYLQNYQKYVKQIKKRAKALLGEVKVIVFGSILKGNYNPMSDIDILVVSKKAPSNIMDQARIKAKLLKGFKPGIFQIHLVSEEEYEGWYKAFIKGNEMEF
jgi:hypothetical protein